MALRREQVDDLLRAPFTYRERPRPVPADGRPLWRVPYVLLLIASCRGQAASLRQLHVLNWALRSTSGGEQLERFMSGNLDAERSVVRYEPALDRAVALAGGIKLLNFEKRLWRLNAAGRAVLADVERDAELLAFEKSGLEAIKRPLTQTAVSSLLKREASSA